MTATHRRTARLASLALVPAALTAQVSTPGGETGASTPRPEIAQLADAPAATMGMKLERTFLQIDVLALTVRVDRGTAAEIHAAISGLDRFRREYEHAVAELAIAPAEAVAEIQFLRGVSLGQFLDAVEDDVGKAVEARWLEPETAAVLADSLPVWFGFLEDRKIRRGDRLSYHVRGDTLRTVFWGLEEGRALLDQTDVGRQNVIALLGAYYAPGSSFRRELVQSLWRGWDPGHP